MKLEKLSIWLILLFILPYFAKATTLCEECRKVNNEVGKFIEQTCGESKEHIKLFDPKLCDSLKEKHKKNRKNVGYCSVHVHSVRKHCGEVLSKAYLLSANQDLKKGEDILSSKRKGKYLNTFFEEISKYKSEFDSLDKEERQDSKVDYISSKGARNKDWFKHSKKVTSTDTTVKDIHLDGDFCVDYVNKNQDKILEADTEHKMGKFLEDFYYEAVQSTQKAKSYSQMNFEERREYFKFVAGKFFDLDFYLYHLPRWQLENKGEIFRHIDVLARYTRHNQYRNTGDIRMANSGGLSAYMRSQTSVDFKPLHSLYRSCYEWDLETLNSDSMSIVETLNRALRDRELTSNNSNNSSRISAIPQLPSDFTEINDSCWIRSSKKIRCAIRNDEYRPKNSFTLKKPNKKYKPTNFKIKQISPDFTSTIQYQVPYSLDAAEERKFSTNGDNIMKKILDWKKKHAKKIEQGLNDFRSYKDKYLEQFDLQTQLYKEESLDVFNSFTTKEIKLRNGQSITALKLLQKINDQNIEGFLNGLLPNHENPKSKLQNTRNDLIKLAEDKKPESIRLFWCTSLIHQLRERRFLNDYLANFPSMVEDDINWSKAKMELAVSCEEKATGFRRIGKLTESDPDWAEEETRNEVGKELEALKR